MKEFAEQQELANECAGFYTRIIPWERYGISHAYKMGIAGKFNEKICPWRWWHRAADKLLDRTALLASSFEEQYPLAQLLTDLQTRPLAEVVNNMLQRFPPPVEVARRVTETGREGPPPPEVLFKIKSLFH